MARSKKAQAAIDSAMDVALPREQVGLGVDIVEIDRMRKILARTPSFARRVFSEAEREYCEGKAQPEIHYATRFAAKEAVVKALGTGFSEGVGVRDIEVRRTTKGRPYIVLTGRARKIAREQGVREIPLSLSFTHTEAVACAMAITEDSLVAAKKRVDPMEELTRQFKDARAMLDDLPAAGRDAPAEGAPASAETAVPAVPAAPAAEAPVPAAPAMSATPAVSAAEAPAPVAVKLAFASE